VLRRRDDQTPIAGFGSPAVNFQVHLNRRVNSCLEGSLILL